MTQEINCISKKATNHADFSTLKIWDQSVHWLKSNDQKVHLCPKQLFAITFKPVDQWIPNFESGKICMVGGLLKQINNRFNCRGLYLVIQNLAVRVKNLWSSWYQNRQFGAKFATSGNPTFDSRQKH